MAKTVFGVVVPNVVWHSSPACPRLQIEFKYTTKPIRYESKEDAFKAGHIRPCMWCEKDIIAEKEEGKYVRLTAEQLHTIRTISKIYLEKGMMSLSEIAQRRDRQVSTCFVITRALVKKGLVMQDLDERTRKAKSRSIRPTAAAARVIKQLANR